jgi:hypothetical protein
MDSSEELFSRWAVAAVDKLRELPKADGGMVVLLFGVSNCLKKQDSY